MTDLPIVLEGITTVEDAKPAIEHGAAAICLSNHGARQLDGALFGFESATEIYETAPQILQQIEVYADRGVRCDGVILKLLTLGVWAVSVGCSFMFSMPYGRRESPGPPRSSSMRSASSIDSQNLDLDKPGDFSVNYIAKRMFPRLWFESRP